MSLLRCTKKELLQGVCRLWIIAFIGNFLGAFIVGYLVTYAQHYPKHTLSLLQEIVQMKMQYQAIGTVSSYFEVILSGSLANWLVGLALFFATMNKNIASKFIPIFLAVSIFVAANFQHSPANMGYFSLYIPLHQNLTWMDAILWNILPAGIGNILGGFVFVALPLWYTVKKT